MMDGGERRVGELEASFGWKSGVEVVKNVFGPGVCRSESS